MNTAIISPCGTYRYLLTRSWGDERGPKALWVMLNPSTANADLDDPTIRRCISFSKRFGCTRLAVVNLFAYRATDPKELEGKQVYRIGPENTTHVLRQLHHEPPRHVVCAWGANMTANFIGKNMAGMIQRSGHTPMCLGTTKSGAPRHPLYLRADTELVEYNPLDNPNESG